MAGAFFPPAELEVGQRENTEAMRMVQSWDTMDTNPWVVEALNPDMAREICKKIYGQGEEFNKAWALINKIRDEDKQKKLESAEAHRARQFEEQTRLRVEPPADVPRLERENTKKHDSD